MMFHPCRYDKEVAELLRNGQWPDVCSADLRAHVHDCQRCGDRVRLSQSFQIARRHSERVAPSIPPGLLWWRAQLQRRNAAIDRVGRPFTVAQGFAISINLVLASSFCISASRQGSRWIAWFRDLPQSPLFHLQALWPSWSMPEINSALLIICAGALTIFSGIVLYLATDRP